MKNKEIGQKSPGTMMLYATNNSLVKRLIDDKENNNDKNFENRNPKINRFGFIGELLNGFISDGTNKMEINFHEKTDLSLTQNKGFSLFFWFLVKKQPQGQLRYILKQGNTSDEITPSIGFLPNCANLFVKILSSKNHQETLFSSKIIEANRLYSLTVTFSIDYENELTDIYLYLDGLLDSQISIPGEPLHNQGKMHLGKVDRNSYGFIGFIADVLLIPRVLNECEIKQIYNACIINLVNNANNYNLCLLRSYEIFERKFERDILLEKYSRYTSSPISVLENLDLLNDELRDIVKKFDENLFANENENGLYTYSQNLSENNNNNLVKFNEWNVTVEDHKVLQKLQIFLESNETEKSIFFRKLAVNATFIFSVYFLISEDQQNLTSKRIMTTIEILKETLHMNIDEKDLVSLAKILGAIEAENINFISLIRRTYYFTRILYPEVDLKICNMKNNKNSLSNYNSASYLNNIHNNTSSAGFYLYKNNQSSSNFQKEVFNSIELHENFLLRSSQQFAYNSGEEYDKEFGMKSTFSIKTLYNRPKSSSRPCTTRGGFGINPSNAEGEDFVNQCNFDDVVHEMNNNNNKNNDNDINVIVNIDNNEKLINEKVITVNNENYENKESMTITTPKLNVVDNIINIVPEININNKFNNQEVNAIAAASNNISNENAQTFNENMNSGNKDMVKSSSNDKDKSYLSEYDDNGFDDINESVDSNQSRKKRLFELEKKLNRNKSIKNNSGNNNDKLNSSEKIDKKIENEIEKEKNIEISKEVDKNNNQENTVRNNDANNINNSKDKETNNNQENKNEYSGYVTNLNHKIMGKNFEETGDQFSNPENMIQVKISHYEMIDNNIQVDCNKIEEEYKEEENMDMDMYMDQNENQISIIELEAKFAEDWNMGNFELIINHCFDCHKHKTTTRHYEYTYVEKFNDLGNSIKEVFPNIRILGNPDKIDHLGCFDIYIRGVGPHLDENGRYYLYSKRVTRKFPLKDEIVDKLVTLSMLYGSSCSMEAAQSQYIRAYTEMLPKQSDMMHDHPTSLTDEAEKEKAILNAPPKEAIKIDPERTKFSCINFGCGKTFTQSENHNKVCIYHTGVWQFGSYNAYWPEAWSCCEKGWGEPGCMRGPHRGVRLEDRINLCLNHGAINPQTNHPDSACGIYYSKDKETCKFHPGFFSNKKQSWTCCDNGDINSDGCKQGKHITAIWPDEKAKLYFYPKPINNPGLNKIAKSTSNGNKSKSSVLSFGHQICKCDFFKPIKQYENPATKFELLKMKREKEHDEMRICFRWGCEMNFKESSNSNKSCLCHPGKWDHGSTGTKMTEFINEFAQDPKNVEKKTILWRPHWSCCGGDWDTKGCKLMRHSGPIIEEVENYNRKYRWPDVRAKLYFPKIVTNKWKKKLEKYIYPENKVKSICKKFFSEERSVSDLPSLCDSLRLYLLVVNDNVDFQLKFMDIALQSNSVAFFCDVKGNVNSQKFIQWWFNDYETIINSITEQK